MMQGAPLNLASCCSIGRTLEAREVLAGAIAGGQDSAPVRSLLGLVLHQLGDLEGARANCARRCVSRRAIPPPNSRWRPSRIIWDGKRKPKAAARRAISWGMDETPVYALLGRILGKQGRLEEAETAWRKAVRSIPSIAQAQRELAGLVWMRTGDLARSARRTGCRAAEP